MAVYGNKEILIKIDELPKINGVAIQSIYRCVHNLSGIKGAYPDNENIFIYYECHPYFHTVNPKKYPVQRIGKLPKELAILFDNVQTTKYKYDDKKELVERSVKVSSIWYRTRCSGNGSFIDDSISVSGINLHNKTSGSISVTRGTKNFGVNEGSKVGKLLLNTLNISYKCELLNEWQYTYYPTTTLRNVDGLNYPDQQCSGWRRSNKMPYVSLDDKKSLRILNENIKAHVYLLKVEPDEVQEGVEYVLVNFNHSHDGEPDKYCNIRSWAHFKEDTPNQMIHYRVDKIRTERDTKNKYAECTVMDGHRGYSKDKISLTSFYQIAMIRNVENID